MNKIKTSLGRGLDALINPQSLLDYEKSLEKKEEKTTEVNIEIITRLPVDKIDPNPFQPRNNFDKESLEELKKSILKNGLIQPITVRRTDSDKYQLISGERRLRVFQELNYPTIPAYILQVASEELMLAMALIENIQRERLNPIEIANAYKRLMEECHLTQEDISERVGKDRTTIANTIRLLKLPDKIKESLVKEEITMGHARALINIPSENLQIEILNKIIGDNLSVRKVEILVKKYLTNDKSPSIKKDGRYITIRQDDSANLSALEDKLRKLFGTKIICKQKQNGTGELIFEFYSLEELDRLLELFDLIEKHYQ
ncbi:MAG: ParB/RepB/Spo0J family partition protein [Ignavibacterium sp.]